METDGTLLRLRALVDEALLQAGRGPLDPSVGVDFVLPDVLESVVMMAFISLIESEFNIEIDETDIDVERFADLHSVAALVNETRGESD